MNFEMYGIDIVFDHFEMHKLSNHIKTHKERISRYVISRYVVSRYVVFISKYVGMREYVFSTYKLCQICSRGKWPNLLKCRSKMIFIRLNQICSFTE